jgi:Putative capsular polysaccharide synthesis protein
MEHFAKTIFSALSLLRNQGVFRFWIVLVHWGLRRFRFILAPVFKHIFWFAPRDGISRNSVLIYQMAKVGSTSLLYSLQFAYLKAGLADVDVNHVHTLINLDAHEQLAKTSHRRKELLATVKEYRSIRTHFDSVPDKRWSAISMVREPVSRHVSDYFHNIDRHLPDWRRRWRAGDLTVDEVVQSFLSAEDHAPIWFDTEIKSVLGIDVFSTPFPHQTGYSIYSQSPKTTLMVMRLEDMDRVAEKAIEQLLGIRQFKLYSFNSGGEMDYSDLYKQFKTKALPAWYIEKTYSTRFAQHFYAKAELDHFAKKWARDNSNNS